MSQAMDNRTSVAPTGASGSSHHAPRPTSRSRFVCCGGMVASSRAGCSSLDAAVLSLVRADNFETVEVTVTAVSPDLSREAPLSVALVGTWKLLSRIDRTSDGQRRAEPGLGDDPVALLYYDRSGHFAAQFMKRDRTSAASPSPDAGVVSAGRAGPNNSRAQGGYDAYFGTYTVDDAHGTVTQRLLGALSPENVGQVLTRAMTVQGDTLTIALETTGADGLAVTRTLVWERA